MSVACIILAAGAGTRFGEPKVGALLPSGERFLDAVVRTAVEAGAEPIVAVVPAGVAVPAPARAVVNRNARGEQIASLRLGLVQLAGSAVQAALLWPVDHPTVAGASVTAIVEAFRRGGAPVVVPTFEGRRGHPALFARELWYELMTVEAGGARAVVHAHAPQVHEIPVPDAGVVRDIDTRSDLPRSDWRPSDALS